MAISTTPQVTDQSSGDNTFPPEESTGQKPEANSVYALLACLFLAGLAYAAIAGVNFAYNIVWSAWHSSVVARNSARTESERMAKIKDSNERTESERIAKIKDANDHAESERMTKIKASNERELEIARIKETAITSPSFVASSAEVDDGGLKYAGEWRRANRESRAAWAISAITIVSKGRLSKLDSAAAAPLWNDASRLLLLTVILTA